MLRQLLLKSHMQISQVLSPRNWTSLRLIRNKDRRFAHTREREIYNTVLRSGFFDYRFYLAENVDVAADTMDPLIHYIRYGADEGRDPGPEFSTRLYFEAYPDVAAERLNPLFHYVTHGRGEGRSPRPFQTACPAVVASPDISKELASSGLFDSTYYLSRYPQADHHSSPLRHYIEHGAREGTNPNAYFWTSWYLERNQDVAASGLNPLLHYHTSGEREGRLPSPRFDAELFYSRHPNLRNKGSSALAHFLRQPATVRAELDPFPNWFTTPATRPGADAGKNGAKLDGAPKSIAVVFLARSETGDVTDFIPFLKSYRRYPAGVEHDLIIIRKGRVRETEPSRQMDVLLSGIRIQYVDTDDVGFDIQAYLRVARLLEHEFVCFLNSHSEIQAEGWLAKLHAPFVDPGVGISGATASYESIRDSVELSGKAIWFANNSPAMDPDLEALFADEIAVHARSRQKLGGYEEEFNYGNRGLSLLDQKVTGIDLHVRFNTYWAEVTRKGGPLHAYAGFTRRFPNPHIRTNAFLMRRRVLLALGFDLGETKFDCVHFESGPDGLPARLADRGLRPVLVGADGQAFEVKEWPRTGTFRQGDQSNVLVSDNRVKEWPALSEIGRTRLRAMTWGEYIGEVPECLREIGFAFKRGELDLRAGRVRAAASGAAPIQVSVVIPTRNRLDLVEQAVATIRAQNYPHWDCTVFDNDSNEPVSEFVASLGDNRISYARSDSFLPVTESWNRAIDCARGDYIILIGDDDGLPPRALEGLAHVAQVYNKPDLVYSSLYQFIHPWVSTGIPGGHVDWLRSGYFFVGRGTQPFELSAAEAEMAVKGSLEFRRNFAFNMQACFFERSFLDRLRVNGKVFHSPFPDYYLANVGLIRSTRTIVVPRPLSLQGVSRKSFGFTLFNDMADRGDALLGTSVDKDPLFGRIDKISLEGRSYTQSYLLTMEHVVSALGPEAPGKVNYGRYRRFQIFEALGGEAGLRSGKAAGPSFERLLPALTRDERQWAYGLIRLGERSQTNGFSALALTRVAESTSMYAPSSDALTVERLFTGRHANLPEAFLDLRRGAMPIDEHLQ